VNPSGQHKLALFKTVVLLAGLEQGFVLLCTTAQDKWSWI